MVGGKGGGGVGYPTELWMMLLQLSYPKVHSQDPYFLFQFDKPKTEYYSLTSSNFLLTQFERARLGGA